MKINVKLLLFVGIIFPQIISATTIKISKTVPSQERVKKIHPLERKFSKPNFPDINKKGYNNLLVLMVDFIQDDNPLTTGDGKFMDSADAQDYPLSLGKPPHDQLFYNKHLRALKNYYLAASLGEFELEYDIFPAYTKGKISAYTLPRKMEYYYPYDGSQELVISRFEEYFTDVFTTADEDESIDFSQYEHFAIIHAGSDWQHDIIGDTPHDIPSFFIKIGDGKEVEVDNGAVTIEHACNIPETITQDIEIFEYENSPTEIYGYGVINAVLAHEFGHSLGFVDLYNTHNFRPAVGYFDIMDSGGLGLIGYLSDSSEEIYYIEGGLPILPGAWHRTLSWGESFENKGILKNINDFSFNEEIDILPAETKLQNDNTDTPYFIKFPISETEYLLIENRQVDPDGDGGTAIKVSNDERVFLYPTNNNDNPFDTLATYEYDYLLPGWLDYSSNAYGGGLLIWHIDNQILSENNNYANNSINTSYSNRAVKIIEADNIQDIGNLYSAYWRGTAYETYFKFKPLLDDSGFFMGWDDISSGGEYTGIFNNELSAYSEPQLKTNTNNPILFSIYDISSYAIGNNQERIMSFKYGINLFENTESYNVNDSILTINQPGMSNFFGLPYSEFSLITEDKLVINYHEHDSANWFTIEQPINLNDSPIDYTLTTDINNDYNSDYILTQDNKIFQYLNSNLSYLETSLTFPNKIWDSPLFLEDIDKLVVPTETALYIGSDSLNIGKAKCTYNNESVVANFEDKLNFINYESISVSDSYTIPQGCSDYYPVHYVDSLNIQKNASFIQNNDGDIYRIKNGNIKQIFNISPYSDQKPTQLALGKLLEGQIYLCFGVENYVFLISTDGTLVDNFPKLLENIEIMPESFPKIISFANKNILYFTTSEQGYIAVNENGEIEQTYSLYWNKPELENYFYYEDSNSRLYFTFSDNNNQFYHSHLTQNHNGVIWNGFKNGNYSLYFDTTAPADNDSLSLIAYAFPNPAQKETVRIRVKNAKESISIKIFDIAGNKIFTKQEENNNYNSQDIEWNIQNISSGIYFGIVKSGNELKKVKIAVEK